MLIGQQKSYRLFRAFRQELLGSQGPFQKCKGVLVRLLSKMILNRKILHHMLDAHLLF